jgi:hypothetical protein
MKHRRIILGLAAVLAAALLVPAAASAKPFEVSRDVGVYAGANTNNGLGVVKAGETVDVQCWAKGQSIGGYAIWDRVKVRNISGYVHDKYVEMPGGNSPAANRIPNCNSGGGGSGGGGTLPEPQPGKRCIARRWIQYLAHVPGEPKGPDHNWDAIYSAAWTPKFCPRGNGDVIPSGKPDVRGLTNPFDAAKNLDFQLGEADERGDGRVVTYRPRLRVCPPAKAPGICFTAARMKMIATLTPSGIRIDRSVATTTLGRRFFFGFLGWRHKPQNRAG